MAALNEATVEQTTLSWFADLGYTIAHGPQFAPGELSVKTAFTQVEACA